MPNRALLMDIDDTLFDFQTGYKRALRAALAQEQDCASGRRLLRDIKEGFRYLLSEKGLLCVAIYFAVSSLANGASSVITLPYFKSTFENGE